MAEALAGLGIAANVVQVIQISEQVISACYQYYRAAKDAKKDVLDIINIVGGLKTTLDNLRILLDDHDEGELPHLKSLNSALVMCKNTIEELASKLGVEVGKYSNTDQVKFTLKKKLMWPWKEKEVGNILQVIEKHKSTFILAVTSDTLGLSLAIQDDIGDMKHGVMAIQSDVEDIKYNVAAIPTILIDQTIKTVLGWLKSTDPSTNHESARRIHEPTTGNWFIQTNAFLKWKNSIRSSLWLTGIPGAGKTVLCSTIIEHVKGLCQRNAHSQIAYFYFDFNDPQKRTIVGMLRSMIVQLCAGEAQLSIRVHDLYNQCNDGNEQPTLKDLIKTLFSLLENGKGTYLIMDALDECSEREKLMDVIDQIIKNPSLYVNLLMTSRKEQDILEGFQDVIDFQIDLKGDGIDTDIELHIRKRLENDKRLRKWNSLIKQEILEALITGAHGM